MKLSPHFSLQEMKKSQTALRSGFDYNPTSMTEGAVVALDGAVIGAGDWK